MAARVEQQQDGLWRVHVDGLGVVMENETHAVTSAVVESFNNPNAWQGREADEVATRFYHVLRARQRAWREAPDVAFSVPPVCTAFWDENAWLQWVDWTNEHNAAVLARFMGGEQ